MSSKPALLWSGRAAAVRVIGLILVLSILRASPAAADAAVPLLMVVWPASWLLLPAIIALEALVAKRLLDLHHKLLVEAAHHGDAVRIAASVHRAPTSRQHTAGKPHNSHRCTTAAAAQ